MTVTKFLTQRVSTPKLTHPGPKQEELDWAYEAAMRAPDHARLKPWRFIQVAEEGLDKLGQLYVDAENFDAVKNAGQELEISRQQKLKGMPKRAPLIVVIIASIQPHPKVPREEQLMAAACATHNLALSLNDQGYGTMWRTGNLAYHPVVKAGLGLEENEEIVGFLYVGTADCSVKTPKPDDISRFVKSF